MCGGPRVPPAGMHHTTNQQNFLLSAGRGNAGTALVYKPMKERINRIAVGLLLIVAVAATVLLVMPSAGPQIDEPGVMILDDPLDPPPFQLTDHFRQPFDNERLQDGWTLAFFGYTHCPDVCPTALSAMSGLAKRLATEHPALAESTRLVFFSVDPHRDTPERLAEHVTYFNGAITGVTGEPTAVKQLAEGLGLHYEYEDPATHDPLGDVLSPPAVEDYLVMHYSGLVIFDDDGRLAASILPPHTVDRLLDVYSRIRG